MAGVGNMQIVLTGNSAQLMAALEGVKKSLKDTEDKGNKAGTAISRFADKAAKSMFSLKGAVIGVVAALAVGKFASGLDAAAETVVALGKASADLGASVESMSALRFAAGEAGVEFEQLSKLAGKAATTVADIVAGGAITARVGALTVKLTDANKQVRSITDLLPDLASGIESASSAAEQLRLAEKFFGRGGEAFVTLLRESGGFIANLATQTERARRLNVLFTPEQVRLLTDYRDAVRRISEAWLGFRVSVMTELAPVLTNLNTRIAGTIAALGRIAGKASALILKAFETGPAGDAARGTLQRVFYSLGSAAKAGVTGLFRIVIATALDGLSLVPRIIGPAVTVMFVEAFIAPIAEIQKQFANMIDDVFPELGDKIWQSAERGIKEARKRMGLSIEQDLDEMVNILGGGKNVAAQWNKAAEGMVNALAGVRSEMEVTFGISQAFADSDIMGLDTIVPKAKKAVEVTDEWKERLKQLGYDMRQTVAGFAGSASDAFADLAIDGKAAFDQLLKSWEKTLLSMALKQLVFQPFFNALSSIGSAPPSGNTGRATVVQRYGGAWERGVQAFAAGGVVDQPTFFGTKRGPGVFGEAGPEAIMPLTRVGGNLGVRSVGGGGTVVQVIDQRSGGQKATVSEKTGADGRRTIRILIRDEVRALIGDGSLDKAMGTAYGSGRRGGVR